MEKPNWYALRQFKNDIYEVEPSAMVYTMHERNTHYSLVDRVYKTGASNYYWRKG